MKKKTEDAELSKYAKMGIAAMLPGMIHAREVLDQRIQELQRQLGAVENGTTTTEKKANNAAAYWAKMSPEQRRKEMIRRGMKGRRPAELAKKRWAQAKKEANEPLKKAAKKRKLGNHPANANHPGHAAWLEKLRAVKKAVKLQVA